jgi:hypothetical protein
VGKRTNKDNLPNILNGGLKSYDGYSTVTLNSNVAYSLYAKQDMAYGASSGREESKGILLVLLPTHYLGPGHNADVFLDEENKNIDGHINMWVKGNLGFYLSKDYKCNPKKQITVDPKSIIAGLNISDRLGKGFQKIKESIGRGEINYKNWEEYFSNYLSGRREELFQPKQMQEIAAGLIEATIVSQIVEIVRRTTLSLAFHHGWSIRGTSLNSDKNKKKSNESISVFFPVNYRKELSDITLPTKNKATKQFMIVKKLAQIRDNPARNYTSSASVEIGKFSPNIQESQLKKFTP